MGHHDRQDLSCEVRLEMAGAGGSCVVVLDRFRLRLPSRSGFESPPRFIGVYSRGSGVLDDDLALVAPLLLAALGCPRRRSKPHNLHRLLCKLGRWPQAVIAANPVTSDGGDR